MDLERELMTAKWGQQESPKMHVAKGAGKLEDEEEGEAGGLMCSQAWFQVDGRAEAVSEAIIAENFSNW